MLKDRVIVVCRINVRIVLREGGDYILPKFCWFIWLTLLIERAKEHVGLLQPVLNFDVFEQEMEKFQNSIIACRFQKYDKGRIFENILLSLYN